MTTTVTEEPFGDGYVKATVAGSIHLVLHEKSGYLNATELWRQYRDLGATATICPIEKAEKLQKFLWKYSGQLKFPADHDGSFIHPAHLLEFATCLSTELYALSALIMADMYDAERRRGMVELLFCLTDRGSAEYSEMADGSRWRVEYGGLKLSVTENGHFDILEFCRQNEGQVANGEQFLRCLNCMRYEGLPPQPHFPPLSFLRLVATLDQDAYVKCVRVIFFCENANLRSLFRSAIAASCSGRLAVEPVERLSGQPPSTPDQNVAEKAKELEKLLAKERLQIVEMRYERDLALLELKREKHLRELLGNETAAAGCSQLSRVEPVVETALQREHRQLMEKFEQERAQKEEALARVKEKEAQLKGMQQQSDTKPPQLQANVLQPPTQTDGLQSLVNASQITPAKSPADGRIVRPETTSFNLKLPAFALQCIVLLKLRSGRVYGCRTAVCSLLTDVREMLYDTAAFVGWFLTHDSGATFFSCKQTISLEASGRRRNGTNGENRVALVDVQGGNEFDWVEGGNEFDWTKVCLEALRMQPYVLEADVRILSTVFDRPTHDVNDYVASTDPETVEFLKRVYKEIENQSVSSPQR